MSVMAQVKAILILQTGGTIDKRYPSTPGAYAFEFGEPAVEKILSRITPSFQYIIKTICTKDSSEITDVEREDMLQAVVNADHQLVLITHGTDSLCDTAHYLASAGVGQGSQFRPGIGEKTVILVGATQPEVMKNSDADFNIGFALGYLHASPPGVFIAMGGSVLDGNHVMRSESGNFLDERHVLKRI